MLTLHLSGQSEKIAPENPWGWDPPPLYHQWRTAFALAERDVHLVVNSYNTGTGKTRAALLHLFALNGRRQDALFIAPTNALLHQHAADVQAFVSTHNLDFKVIAVTAAMVQQYRGRILAQGDYEDIRKGEVLVRLIRNYREFHPGEYRRQGLLFVVNPDIFYYALMFQYGSHDQRNLFENFLAVFTYIIIDEFHYYDQKQLAFFLFFFSISRKMGYFVHAGRKICLLSATPNERVIAYLNRLFGDNWSHICPDNEPAESASYKTTPTLSPLTLRLYNDELVSWGQSHLPELRQWIEQDGGDGAIISDALRRVNQLYAFLCGSFADTQVGRITGPEPEEKRQIATGRPLILATPTVDIGYNFEKRDKSRQNIDFLVCEARFGDDLIQRIGRAGRILGKEETDVPSTAVALLNDAALDALRLYDEKTLSRAQFKEIIHQHADQLPHKHNLIGYIRTWAITEVFYPIYQAYRLVQQDDQQALEELYQELRDLFDERSTSTSFRSLSAFFRKYYHRRQWLEAAEKTIPINKETAEQVADWFRFNGHSEYSAADLLPHLAHESVIGIAERQEALRRFVAGQVHLTRSLFNFRDSFQGPTAVIADPEALFSSEPINSYDIFHLVETFDIQWLDNRAEFAHLYGDTDLHGDLYGRLRHHRNPLLTLELHYETEERQEEFIRQWEGRPVALDNFRLYARERAGDLYPLDGRIIRALQDMYLTVLLIPPDMKGWAIRALRNTPIYGRRLIIDFLNRQGVEYTVYIGKAAWVAYPELQVAFKIRDRMKSEAIIL